MGPIFKQTSIMIIFHQINLQPAETLTCLRMEDDEVDGDDVSAKYMKVSNKSEVMGCRNSLGGKIPIV